MSEDRAINIRVPESLGKRIDRARAELQRRNPGVRASQADAVRAMIEAGADAVIRGEANGAISATKREAR